MKKKYFYLLIFQISIFSFFVFMSFSCNSTKMANEESDTLVLKWATENVFKTPESVFFDTVRNCIYVSNINGKPSDIDSNGFISKLSEKGEIVTLEWITGFNAPKGMDTWEDKLFVSDINYLVEIDINTQKIVNKYFAENSEFLNDVVTDNLGNVYVSDISTNKIYKLENDTLKLWIDSEKLNHPNGLFFCDKNLFAGSGNAILKINPETKDFSVLRNNTGSIDGLEMTDDDNFIISDWLGNINIVYTSDSLNLILSTEKQDINAADIDFVISKKLLLVPTFGDNRIMAYELIKKSK